MGLYCGFYKRNFEKLRPTNRISSQVLELDTFFTICLPILIGMQVDMGLWNYIYIDSIDFIFRIQVFFNW